MTKELADEIIAYVENKIILPIFNCDIELYEKMTEKPLRKFCELIYSNVVEKVDAKYLIVRCNELGDQWECDADREPWKIVDDLVDFISKEKEIEVPIEIYKIVGSDIELLMSYDYGTNKNDVYEWLYKNGFFE